MSDKIIETTEMISDNGTLSSLSVLYVFHHLFREEAQYGRLALLPSKLLSWSIR